MGSEAYLWWPLEYAGVTGRVVGIEAERAFIETPRGLFPTLLDTRFRAASEYEVLAREGDVRYMSEAGAGIRLRPAP